MKTKEQIKKEIEQKQQELDLLQKELESIKDLKEAWREEYELDRKNDGYSISGKLSHYAVQSFELWMNQSFELWMNQIDLMSELQTFAKLRNGDWVADWGNENQLKLGVILRQNKCTVECFQLDNLFVYGISFKSSKIAIEAIEIFGERIEQFYGK